ncbi:type II toxin-antitoxin system PemK/MazF family toxin [Acinetobacter sp. CUI P1]|nr:type II toxin-antitoxin system PemK/MazF family toxin [Acinetobacter sp. CUI P1]
MGMPAVNERGATSNHSDEFKKCRILNESEKKRMMVSRGEIYWIKDTHKEVGSVQKVDGLRPALIISNNKGNYYSTTVVVVMLSGQVEKAMRKKLDCQIIIDTIVGMQVVMCEQIRTVDKVQLNDHITKLSKEQMRAVEEVLKLQLNL